MDESEAKICLNKEYRARNQLQFDLRNDQVKKGCEKLAGLVVAAS
jgi:hypothetical protein